MRDCPYAAQIPDWLLGTLPAEQASAFGGHLRSCASCSAEVARLAAPVDAMADAAPQIAPPPELRDRVLAAIRDEAALFEAAQAAPPPVPASRLGRGRLLIAAGAAALCLLALGVLAGSALDSGPGREGGRTVAGSVTAAGGGPGARAAIVVGGRGARLSLERAAPPPPGQAYQVWMIRPPAKPMATGGLFSVPPSGTKTIGLPPLSDIESVIVTAEPEGGSLAPTMPAVVVVALRG